jgi:hypothetical protein
MEELDYSTPEMCLIAVEQNKYVFMYVPEHLKTPSMCLAAVNNWGRSLTFVPHNMRTYEICLAAIQTNGIAIEHVPEHIITHELCLIAVQTGESYNNALEYIPSHMKTPEICLASVIYRGESLYYVPEHLKTYEMCLISVEQDGMSLYHVPEHFQTDELIGIAVDNNPEAEQYIKVKKTITILHGSPKQMPEKAYDTLEMGYDKDTAIRDGELMVDFHKEFEYGRFYRKKTFEDMVLESKKNPTTRSRISEYTIYQARV